MNHNGKYTFEIPEINGPNYIRITITSYNESQARSSIQSSFYSWNPAGKYNTSMIRFISFEDVPLVLSNPSGLPTSIIESRLFNIENILREMNERSKTPKL